MPLPKASRFKGGGYLTSTISVLLLAMVSIKSASRDPWMLACLILGALTSIGGMAMRWRSHLLQQAEKKRMKQEIRGRDEPPGK